MFSPSGRAVAKLALSGEAVWSEATKDSPSRLEVGNNTGGDEQLSSEHCSPPGERLSPSGFRRADAGDGLLCWLLREPRDENLPQSLNCLPGSGWYDQPEQLPSHRKGAPFVANRYIIENGGHRERLSIGIRTRPCHCKEYWGKVYTVVDSVALRRSDGALVRITAPVGKSESEALKAATEIAAQVSTTLPEFIPD